MLANNNLPPVTREQYLSQIYMKKVNYFNLFVENSIESTRISNNINASFHYVGGSVSRGKPREINHFSELKITFKIIYEAYVRNAKNYFSIIVNQDQDADSRFLDSVKCDLVANRIAIRIEKLEFNHIPRTNFCGSINSESRWDERCWFLLIILQQHTADVLYSLPD